MKRREFLASGVAALAGGGLMGGAAAKRPGAAPNILWIHMDDGRADALGCYGAPWARTPYLDGLASRGVRFENTIVQSPICVPARRSLKTGCYVHEAGPMAMGAPTETPPPYLDTARMEAVSSRPNLLDAFSRAGRKPVSLGKVHALQDSFDHRGDAPMLFDVAGRPTQYFKNTFGEDSAILQGERYFTSTHGWQIGGILDIAPEQTETWRLGTMAVETLEQLSGEEDPFFLRVSFHAPHVACYVPREYFIDPATVDLPLPTAEELAQKPRFEQGPLRTYCAADLTREQIDICRGTYFGMVSLLDVQVGRMLDTLQAQGSLDNTLIAFTSDQGFQLGEHGLWKKRAFYDGNVRVPLILCWPGHIPEGTTVYELVEHVDFLPTLLDCAGITVPENIRGRSLMPLITGGSTLGREAAFCEIDHSQSMYEELRHGGRRVMVRTREWKLIEFMDRRISEPDGALYHLYEDPGERNNLHGVSKYADITAELRSLAHDWDPTTAI